MFCDVPDGNFEIDFHDVDQDPIEMAIYRGGRLANGGVGWRTPGEKLHGMMGAEVRLVLKPKNILHMEKIAKDFDWLDKSIFAEIAQGFCLKGVPKPMEVFLPEAVLPTMTMERLQGKSGGARGTPGRTSNP